MGVYPMLRDETCCFLAVDFNKDTWRTEAYRRDRRKDALLQEQGDFVLRFLAEDLAKRVDEVLDAILRALAHRERALGPLGGARRLAWAGDGS